MQCNEINSYKHWLNHRIEAFLWVRTCLAVFAITLHSHPGFFCLPLEYLWAHWGGGILQKYGILAPPSKGAELLWSLSLAQSGDFQRNSDSLGLHTTACAHYQINVPDIKHGCIYLCWKGWVLWNLECWTLGLFLSLVSQVLISCNPVKWEHILLIIFKMMTCILSCSYIGKADYCYTKDDFDLLLTHLPKFSFIWLLLSSEDLDSSLFLKTFFEELTSWHQLQLLRASGCYNWSYPRDKNEPEKTWNGIMAEHYQWFSSPEGQAVLYSLSFRGSIASPTFCHPLWTLFAAAQ